MNYKIIDIIPIRQVLDKHYLRDKKLSKILKKQNFNCKLCSAIVFELAICYKVRTHEIVKRYNI